MRQTLLVSLITLLFIFSGGGMFAQSVPEPGGSPALKKLAKELQAKNEDRQKKAIELAKKNNWIISKTLEDGTVIKLKGLRPNGQPNYSETHNLRAAYTTKANRLWEGGSLGLSLSGNNLGGKLGIWDGGMIRLTHQELKGRIVVRDTPTALSDHATHVAGTMIATGVRPEAKGMAYKAPDLQAYDFFNDVAEMAVSAKDLLISNHSYGTIAGWRFNPGRAGTPANPNWEWWGDESVSATEDWKFGFYDEEAQDFDKIAYNAPYYLICKSSGNNRSQTGPAIGQPYWKINWSNFSYVLVPARSGNISSNNGYDIISTYGNAKNILTIGALNSAVGEDYYPGELGLTGFSSWGPTDDGRIKPDVVGAGAALISSTSTADDAYATLGGTSMSSPNVSGTLALLQEHFSNLNGGKFMLSATLKALVIHTADAVGTTGQRPTYSYGWGLVNAEKAAKAISNKNQDHILRELVMQQGGEYKFQVTASGAGSLLATIAWTDPEGNVVTPTSATLNDRTPKLVNDLDIRISDESNTTFPYILDPANPANPATKGDNFRDNVEQVEISSPVPGKTYTISIKHKGTLARGPQAYSLVVSGINPEGYCISNAINTADSKILKLDIAGVSFAGKSGCSPYIDFSTDTVPTAYLKGSIPLSLNLGSCGENYSKIAKIFIDWNNDGDFNDSNELAATSPIISDVGSFNTSIAIPEGIQPGNFTRVRIVMVETDTPSAVSACGEYEKGETWDLTIRFLKQPVDIAVTGLTDPIEGFCKNNKQSLTVTVKNEGSAPINKIAFRVTVKDPTQVVASITDTIENLNPALTLLLPGQEKQFYLSGSFIAKPGTTYTFSISAKTDSDPVSSNDSLTVTRTSGKETNPPVATATICGSEATILKGKGDGTIFWYSKASGGELLAAGNNTTTTYLPSDKTYYASLNELDASVGPKTKEFATAGGYNQFGPSVAVTAQVPVVIESARLYIGTGGRITFRVNTEDGRVVSTKTLEVNSTINTSIPGPSPTVPYDTGRVYPLGLEFPEAGNYLISIEYDNTATIYRNNAGVSGYPFEVPGVFAITGNTAGANFYYYLYDLKLKGLGCPSPRVPVKAKTGVEATATITVSGDTAFCEGNTVVLMANTGEGLTYQWLKDGEVLEGSTDSILVVSESGKYAVTVTLNNACFTTSEVKEIIVHPLPPSTVRVIPNSSTHLCSDEQVEVLLQAVTGENISALNYQWYYNSYPVQNGDNATFVATQPGKYFVSVSNLAFDCGTSFSDTVTIIRETPVITASNSAVCVNQPSTLVASTTVGTIFWYDAPVGGNLLAVGDSLSVPAISATKKYFVGVNDLRDTLNSPAYDSAGGFSSFTGGRMYFNASMPFILEKATINAATPGSMLVYVFDKDSSENIIAAANIPLTAGINEYDVNLYIPKAGKDYGIQVVQFAGGASAYRNNTAGAASFPYEIPGVVSITGTNQLDQSSFYYFLYDWQISVAGCASKERKEVKAEVKACVDLFTVVDVGNNTDHKTLENGDKINIALLSAGMFNIRANTNPASVGSVKFVLDGKVYSIDNNRPYALAGDINGRYFPAIVSLGKHTLTATPYSGKFARGSAGIPQTIEFEVVNTPVIESFTLINSKTDKEIGAVTEGMVIDIEKLKDINIKANTKPGAVAYVKFFINGKAFNTAYLPPYSLAGNLGNNYFGWNVKPGKYTLKATPYSLASLGKEEGESLTVNFTVVKGASSIATARYNDGENISFEGFTNSITVAPNPIENKFQLIFKEVEKGTVDLNITDGYGKIFRIGKKELSSQQEAMEVDITSLNLPSGVYVLRVNASDKPQRIVKIIKK